MSFGKEDYEFKKEYEKIVVENIEKIGDLLIQIDEISKTLRFYAIEMKWDDGKKQILDSFRNFMNLGEQYNMWRDHILYRIYQGDKVLKLKESLIKRLEKIQ